MKHNTNLTQEEDDYYAELDTLYDPEVPDGKEKHEYEYAGSYEADKGDFEGACLARAEFEAGYLS